MTARGAVGRPKARDAVGRQKARGRPGHPACFDPDGLGFGSQDIRQGRVGFS